MIKNFEKFPSNSFSFIFVVKFDNLITNDIKKLTQKYFSLKIVEKKKSFNPLESFSEIYHPENIETPEFRQKNSFRPTLLSMKSNNGDVFEIYLNLESFPAKIVLQVDISSKLKN